MVPTKLLTIEQLVAEVPAFTASQIRWYIFHCDKYAFTHVIVKVGRRVLLDVMEFNRWLEKHRKAPLPQATV